MNRMDDLISRQAAIDAVRRSEALDRAFGYGHAVDALRELPSAQPETHEERTETHACDCISRKEAIDALHGYFDGMLETDTWSPCDIYGLIEILPSAQPDITRDNDCNGCKFVGCYDTDFPCANCVRKDKDYYEPEG